jgi:hypothetical protein
VFLFCCTVSLILCFYTPHPRVLLTPPLCSPSHDTLPARTRTSGSGSQFVLCSLDSSQAFSPLPPPCMCVHCPLWSGSPRVIARSDLQVDMILPLTTRDRAFWFAGSSDPPPTALHHLTLLLMPHALHHPTVRSCVVILHSTSAPWLCPVLRVDSVVQDLVPNRS